MPTGIKERPAVWFYETAYERTLAKDVTCEIVEVLRNGKTFLQLFTISLQNLGLKSLACRIDGKFLFDTQLFKRRD